MKKTLTLIGCSIFVATLFMSCEKNEINEEITSVENVDAEASVDGKTIHGSKNMWFSHTDGAYTSSRWNHDFGNQGSGGSVDQWEFKRLRVVSKGLRITSYANTVGNSSGIWSKVQIQPHHHYTLEYKVKFQSGFKWAHGGKLPGLSGGGNYSGCEGWKAKQRKDGWSFRPMWHQWDGINGGTAYIDPYAYYEWMPENCGEDFNSRKSIQVNKWHIVKIDIKMNTSSSKNDGFLILKLDGVSVIYKDKMKWASTWSGRKISNIMFDVFRGGKENKYKSPTTDYIFIDNMKLVKK